MKVKAMIEELKKMDPEMSVVITSEIAKYGMDVDSIQKATMIFGTNREERKYCEIKIDDRDFELDSEAFEELENKKMED